tara:strand:- start:101 stop:3169 length:3069 start_codon:yes stop_codon:yes gene_type:complete
MVDLVTIAQTDSTNDGSGASTIMEPPQVDNATDDAILIKVTQSLNNSANVSNINVTTPTGYTLLRDLRDGEVRSWLYYKRSTGSETIPTVISDTTAKWTCTTAVVTDVDWVNGGVAQQVSNTGGGDQQSPDLTTDSSGTASAIVCFFSLERRAVQGFRYPQTRPETVYGGTVSTGTGEGVDNAAGAGFDFITDRNTVWEGPFWETSAGADSLAINVEVLVQGNIIPLQSSTFVTQRAPDNSLQTTMNWCREIVDSGKDLDGNTLDTWSFNASSDVSAASDTITITGHGMDESMVLYFTDGGNTAPAGLSNDTFYYAFPQDANTIKLCTVNEDTDNIADYYYNGTTQRPVVNITGIGTGTMTFTEARMINAAQSILDVLRPSPGSSANIGPAPASYIGDGGYNQNFVATAQRFNSVFDATGETITFELQVNGFGRLDRVLMTLIDEDGDWINWKLYQKPVSPNSTGQLIYQFQVDQASVKALKYQEHGTFDHTRIRYLVIAGRGNNVSTNRFLAISSASSVVNLGGAFTVIGGANTTLTQLVELAETYTSSITKPSDLQVVSTIPLAIGNGTSDVSFVDSEKSIAFPPLADGINTFQNYLDSLGVAINATSGSTVKLQNSQIGASVPYTFDVTAASGATIDLTGNSYVFGTTSLDADAAYNRQLFVGGEGVKDNGAEIRNSTFIVNSQLGADKGIVDLDSNTDIESSAFELSSGTTTGHGIKIIAAGSYTLNELTFNNFGADGSSTAAVYNDSGGAVTITNSGGTAPTVRNGTGASTIVQDPPQPISITNISAGSRLQIHNVTTSTETVNQVVAGTSYTSSYTEGVEYTDGDTVRVRLTKLGKDEWSGNVLDTSSGFSVLAEQVDSAVYAAMGVDGSTVTKFAADYAQNDVNLIIGTDWTMAELYAWWMYNLTTEQGIREFFGGITAIDQSNFRINAAIVNLFLDNNTNASHKQTDNRRLFRDTGDGYPIKSPTTSGYGLDAVWRNTILIAETGVSGLTPAESAKLDVISDVDSNTKLIPALL